MTVKKLESMLLDDMFVIDVHALQKSESGTINLHTDSDAREFFIKLLISEAIVGVNYSDEELLETYRKVNDLVSEKSEVSSEELPYHPLKKRPTKEVKFILDGCCCKMLQ